MLSAVSGLLGLATGSGAGTPVRSTPGRYTPSSSSSSSLVPFADPTPADLEQSLRILLSPDSSTQVLISEVRKVAEIVVFAEQKNAQSVLDMFFERNVIGTLRAMVLKEQLEEDERRQWIDVQIQVLQTLSILAQSLKHETNLFHFLSQNHINAVISHSFDFQSAPEELLAHYVTLLKTVSLRLNRHLCQFFYDARNPEQFPLYDKAVLFFNNDEPLVRAAARSVILMVHRVDDADVDEYISRRIDFFEGMCDFIHARFAKLQEIVSRSDFDANWLNKIEAGLSDVMDDYSFLQDVLSLRHERKANIKKLESERRERRQQRSSSSTRAGGEGVTVDQQHPSTPTTVMEVGRPSGQQEQDVNPFERVTIERVLDPLLARMDDHLSVWGIAQCCLVMNSPQILCHIHSRTLLSHSSRSPELSLWDQFRSEDERLALAAISLAYFLVDRLPENTDVSFVSRKKALGDGFFVPRSSSVSDSENVVRKAGQVEDGYVEQKHQGDADMNRSARPTGGRSDDSKRFEEPMTVEKNAIALATSNESSAVSEGDSAKQIDEDNLVSSTSSVDVNGSGEREGDARGSSTQASETHYPSELAEHLLQELVHRTSSSSTSTSVCARPVLIRLIAKLLVHVTFDSRLLDSGELFLSPSHSELLKRAMSQAATKLKEVADKKSFDPALLIESFENEWRDLKAGPLKVSSLVTNPSSVLTGPDWLFSHPTAVGGDKANIATSELEEKEQDAMYKLKNLLQDRVPLSQRNPLHRVEEIRALANIYMVLRLCWASLEQAPDVYLPSVGNADVDSIRENSAIDLRRCEFLEVQALVQQTSPSSSSGLSLSNRLLLVLVAGAMILVEPDNDRRTTGICRSVSPIHRIEIGSDVKDPSILHLCVRSSRRIGLSVRIGGKQEWSLSLKFDSQPKALFARDHIERAAQRARDDKFKRIQAMLDVSLLVPEINTSVAGTPRGQVESADDRTSS